MASHGSVRIELDHDGFRQLLCSEGVGSLVQSTAKRIASNAGEGFEASANKVGSYGGGRIIAYVRTTDLASRLAEANDKALTRAVHG